MPVKTIRTLTGERLEGCGPARLSVRRRLQYEWDSLKRLPDRLHDRPIHLTDWSGAIAYSVLVEKRHWVLRRSTGRGSWRLLARPIAVNLDLGPSDYVGAARWAERYIIEHDGC